MVLAVAVKQSCSLSFCYFLLIGLVWATIGSNSNLSCSALATPVKQQWKPKVANLEERRQLRGQVNESETIGTKAFHHVEFYCGDAKSTAHRFSSALGMPITGTSGQHTGNDKCVSYGLESGQVRFLLTAPYSKAMSSQSTDLSSTQALVTASTQIDDAPNPLPDFSPADAHQFFAKHGMAVRAVGLEVKDAQAAFEASVANGARPVLEPTFVPTCHGQSQKGQTGSGCYMAEVALYGDVVLRYLSFPDAESSCSNKRPLPFLPHLTPVEGKMAERKTFGLRRIDHAVGNVPNLFETLAEVSAFTGFHDFAEFASEDVGTVESGLNSVVLASDSEDVLLPLNEPVNGK
jgi:4-hydroxyphenylpyruvate dioxygenase